MRTDTHDLEAWVICLGNGSVKTEKWQNEWSIDREKIEREKLKRG